MYLLRVTLQILIINALTRKDTVKIIAFYTFSQ